MKFINKIIIILILLTICSCSSLQIKPVYYGWPVERVLDIDQSGKIDDIRYSISFDVDPIFYEEFQDTSYIASGSIRIIRDSFGYYFITAQNFRHVYVFDYEESSLVLKNKILVSETGLTSPALNQRSPYIEVLLDESNSLLINCEGIKEE